MADSKGNCVMSDQYNRIQGAVIKTQQKNYSVYKGVNTIGRNKNAIINLKNLNVSQNHAVIIIVDDTQHFISDLNSSNGTYLVGAKLSPYKLYELVNDVEIKFGDVPVFYSRVANTDTTIHLQMECNDMTQNMTQNFYEAGTQLMINESSLNWTSLNNKTHTCGSDVVPGKDIHRGPTQPSTSLAALRQKMSIHDEPTQVVDLPQDIEKLAEEEINIHEMATQVVDLPQAFKKLKEREMDIHEMPTQIVGLPRDFNSLEKCQDVNLHEMPTQVVTIPQGLELSKKSSDSSTQLNEDFHRSDHLVREETNTDAESNELFVQNTSNMCAIEETVIEETVIDETHLEKDGDSNDSINFLAINKPVTNEHATCSKEAKSANDNDSILSDSQDIVKSRKRPVRKLSSSEDFTQSHNNKPICNSDSDTDIDNEIDVRTKITHKNLPTIEGDVSGSETEIEDDLPEQFKNKSKILNSDSETDMEEHLSCNEILTQSQNIKPKILNKKRVLDSDSETDIENDMQNDVELSQSQNIIKPKILNKKRMLDSDSETDIENDKENSVDLKQDHNKSNTDSLNDTDCIPPTQDDFADMFVYKNPQISTANMNTQNESSEESFKLGLTELMAESIENKYEENALEEDKTNHAQGSASNASVVDDDNDQQLKNNKELNLSTGDDEEVYIPKVIENKAGDVYLAPTQKISTDSSNDEGNQQYAHVETMGADQSNTAIILNPVKETAPTEDDFYMMPTQKLYENNQATTSSISKKLDKEADDDFYMMPTQKHNQNNNQPEFKTPRKKYNFRKKEVKLDESLSSIFSKNPDDLYSALTQKINEEEDKAEDIYLQPTQKVNEEKKQSDLYLQPTQDLNLIAAHKDEDFYMVPTQKININVENNITQNKILSDSSLQDNQHIPLTIGTTSKITEKSDEDLYMAATQPINSGPIKSVTDIYLQETQDLGLTKNIESSKNKIENITIQEKNKIEDKNENPDKSGLSVHTSCNTEKHVEDPYSVMTQPVSPNFVEKTVTKVLVNTTAQPIDSGPSKSVTDLYLQETQDLGLSKNIDSSKNNPKKKITIQERNKIEDKDKNHHDRSSSNLQTSHDTEKQEDPYSAMTQQISPNLVDKTVPVNTTAQPINSGPSKSVTDLYLQETQDLALTKNIDSSKNKTKKNITIQERNKIEDKDENHHDSSNLQTIHNIEKHEDPYSAMTQPISPNLVDKTVNKVPVNTTAQPINSGPSKSVTDLYLQETQDLSLTKNIESSKNKTKKNIKIQERNKIEDKTIHDTEKHDEDPYLAMTQPTNPNLVDKSVAKVPVNKSVTDIYLQETEDMGLIKKLDGNKNDKNEDPYMMPTQQIIQEDGSLKTVQSDVVEEKMSSETKRHIQPNMNTSKLNKKRKLTDAETEKSSDSDTFIKKPLPTLRKTRKSEAGPSVETSKEKTVVDDSETLSQIQRFVVETSNISKKAKVKTLPKKRSTTEAQIDVQSETLSQIEAFIKKPLNTITEDPRENIKTPSKRQKKEKVPDKIEPVDEEFQKPETSTRSRRSKSTIQPKTHVSKEECEAFDKSDSDVSTSSNRSDKSFALLEAKSTKTRKSQRLVNPVEVKVTVCKNRRSMATSAVSESSSSESSVPSPTVFTSPEKGKRKQKPKVVFTMLDSPLLESLIRQLGGSVVDSVESSTILVTEQVKRSQKLLTAVGQGKPICSPEWIRASKKANEFLDPWNYILLDKEAETKWNFSLRASLMRASNTKLLSNYTFLVIVNNAEDVLKGAIKACGGKCVPRCPAKNVDENFVVIASPENKSKYLKIRKQHPQVIIVEPEAIFDGVLRQELRLDKHIVV